MSKSFSTSTFRKSLSKSEFLLHCEMPLGYSQGIPILRMIGEKVCLVTPFLKYKVTGKEDETLVYPIRYTISAEVPTGKIVGFENLQYNIQFANTDFSTPIGKFRHEAIRRYNKVECGKLFEELYGAYDVIIAAISLKRNHTDDDKKLRGLIEVLLAPELRKAYKLLDQVFYDQYIGESIVQSVDVKATHCSGNSTTQGDITSISLTEDDIQSL